MKTAATGCIWMLLCVLLLAGCGGNVENKGAIDRDESAVPKETEAPRPILSTDPVTLNFYIRTVLDDTAFNLYIKRFVDKKFPHVTLDTSRNATGNQIQDLVAAGRTPDIMWEGLTNLLGVVTDLGVPADLTAVAKKWGSDFSEYDPGVMANIRSSSNKGEVLFLPFNTFSFALHYNKDIFEKFGVPFPVDHMTWDQAIELGKRVTRLEGNTQYIGIRTPNIVNRMKSQLSLSYVDEAGKPAINNAGWRKLFDMYSSVHSPLPDWNVKNFNEARTQFNTGHTLAMLPEILQLINTNMVEMEEKGLRWDLVTYPTFSDRPGITNGAMFIDGFVLGNSSPHADVAFNIVHYLTTDLEVQTEATKNGRVTALNNQELKKFAFENNPAAKGKNLQAAFALKYPAPPIVTEYDASAQSIVNSKLLELVNKKTDANTLLRQAQEEFEKKVAEMDAAKGK